MSKSVKILLTLIMFSLLSNLISIKCTTFDIPMNKSENLFDLSEKINRIITINNEMLNYLYSNVFSKPENLTNIDNQTIEEILDIHK